MRSFPQAAATTADGSATATSAAGRSGAVVGIAIAILAGLPSAASAQSAADDVSYSLELDFVTHLDMDMPEQDVFVERVADSGRIYRVTSEVVDMDTPMYGTAVEVRHNPFDPGAIGPHPKGDALGFTLGEWLRHEGSGTYECSNGEARLDLEFTGLVPNGVYTLWHAFIAIPPPEPFTGTLDLPLGARDGSQSVFRASSNGEASVTRRFEPCLQLSASITTSMVALNYHSDGRVYGGYPGKSGLNSHIPLFVMLPKYSEVE